MVRWDRGTSHYPLIPVGKSVQFYSYLCLETLLIFMLQCFGRIQVMYIIIQEGYSGYTPGRRTCKLKVVSKRNEQLFQGSILRFHLCFRECNICIYIDIYIQYILYMRIIFTMNNMNIQKHIYIYIHIHYID